MTVLSVLYLAGLALALARADAMLTEMEREGWYRDVSWAGRVIYDLVATALVVTYPLTLAWWVFGRAQRGNRR